MRRGARRFARERSLQHGLHLRLRGRRLAGQARLVVHQTVQALLGEALLPAPHHRTAHPGLSGNLQHGQALVRQQHDPGAQHVFDRMTAVVDDILKGLAGLLGQHEGNGLGHNAQTRTSHSRCESFECVIALDFYMVFPFRIDEIRLTREQRTLKKLAADYASQKPYGELPDSNVLFDRMRPISDAVIAHGVVMRLKPRGRSARLAV